MADPATIALLYATDFVPDAIVAMARAQTPEGFRLVPLDQKSSPAQRAAVLSEANVVFAYPGDPTKEEIASATNLKLFQTLSAGYDWLDLEAFRRAGIVVANNGGANAPTTAEHTLLLILAVYKRLPFHHNALVNGRWPAMQETMRMREFGGKTLGLVGFGQIARAVAQLASGFDVNVLYHARHRAERPIERQLRATFVAMDELLALSDVVSLHTPLTTETERLIDGSAIAKMKSTAILINTSRGRVVDEDALVIALRERRIAGAGLDVFRREPLPAESPLLLLDNVVLTSHIAGVTLDTWTRRLAFSFANARRAIEGNAVECRIA